MEVKSGTMHTGKRNLENEQIPVLSCPLHGDFSDPPEAGVDGWSERLFRRRRSRGRKSGVFGLSSADGRQAAERRQLFWCKPCAGDWRIRELASGSGQSTE